MTKKEPGRRLRRYEVRSGSLLWRGLARWPKEAIKKAIRSKRPKHLGALIWVQPLAGMIVSDTADTIGFYATDQLLREMGMWRGPKVTPKDIL
jgi:hypothetical protein